MSGDSILGGTAGIEELEFATNGRVIWAKANRHHWGWSKVMGVSMGGWLEGVMHRRKAFAPSNSPLVPRPLEKGGRAEIPHNLG